MTVEALAPAHLSAESAAWYRRMVADFDMAADVAALKLLQAAAEAWDRLQQARRRVARDGAYVTDRFGQLRPHPALAVERDSRLAFARLVRELGLAADDPNAVRPPQIPGRYAG